MKLHLEDVEAGTEFVSGEVTITERDIIAFAEQFDPQPFHLDPNAAQGSFFRGLAASGWHTAATTMRLLVTEGPDIAGGIIGAGGATVVADTPRGPAIAFTCARSSNR